MQNIKNKIIFFISLWFFLALPFAAFAHSGGGPPFLKVNGEYAQTNPYSQGWTTLAPAQDITTQSYIIGEPIHLSVDIDSFTKQISIPQSMLDELHFRWSFAQGDNFGTIDHAYHEGPDTTYTFKKPRSYLVILEAKTPYESDYVVIDTVQLDVLPNASYKLPHVSFFVGTQALSFDKPILLVARGLFDTSNASAKYLWDFNEGSVVTSEFVEKKFVIDKFAQSGVLLRVIDNKGFITDAGFAIESINWKMKIIPLGLMKKAPVKLGTYAQAQQLVHTDNVRWSLFILLGQLLLVAIVIIFFVVAWRKRRSREQKQ